MARKFDSFERQVEIRKLKKEIKEQKFEEKQKEELKELRHETFRRSPKGKIISGIARLSDLTVKAIIDPKSIETKTSFGKALKGFFVKPQKKKVKKSSEINGELIGSPFPKKKNKGLIF